MGYTHYWYKPAELDPDRWAEFVGDARKLIDEVQKTVGIPLPFEYDQPNKHPVAGRAYVQFNGEGDAGHETLSIDRVADTTERARAREGTKCFAFCKTAHKPYDLAVTAVLIALKHHFEDAVSVSSDGDKQDWEPGRKLTQATFGYGWDFDPNSDA